MTTTLTITVAEIQELDQLFDELMLARRAGQGAAGETAGSEEPAPALPAKELARVEAVGEVAYRHRRVHR